MNRSTVQNTAAGRPPMSPGQVADGYGMKDAARTGLMTAGTGLLNNPALLSVLVVNGSIARCPIAAPAHSGRSPSMRMAKMIDGNPRALRPSETGGIWERPVLPTGALRRGGRVAVLPLRHAARTAAAASRLSRTATDQVAARTADQVFATLGELKGGAAKLGQAMSVFEAAMPEEVSAPYRSALRRLTDAQPAMPAEVARRIVAADLAVAYGPAWRQRLVTFGDTPVAAASIGQVHRGRWRDDRGRVVDVAVKVQYPGVGKALRSDLRQARLLARVMARLTRLNISGLADELATRIVEELDYVREGRVQAEVTAAFTRRVPEALAVARAAGVREPPGRASVTVPAVYAATPRVLITGWLEGPSLSTLLDGRTDLLPAGWRELGRNKAADLAAQLLSHAIYAPAACTGWMHADLHAGNFLLLPGGRLGMLDFGAVAATPGGIPAAFGQLAAAVLAGDGPAVTQLARQAGALGQDAQADPQLIVELLHPIAATAAASSFTYSRPWLRGLMAHLTAPRFAPAVRKLTPPREYALVWRATLSAAGLFAQLGATVPTRGFHLAYSPGFRGDILPEPAAPQA
jgi:predicted unusual protein kinase regulating ubiquinone biosynthesis (AarF/ABC1/UbiB family)